MKTQVESKRELFGFQIGQQEGTEFLSATDLAKVGNSWRFQNGLNYFNLSQYLKGSSFLKFKKELEDSYGEVLTTSKGRGSNTWVHPLIFIDILFAINADFKIENCKWLSDTLIKFRNKSCDSHKEMCAGLCMRFKNKRELPNFINLVDEQIKNSLSAYNNKKDSEEYLKKIESIHKSIRLFCNVLESAEQAVRFGIAENI